MLRKKPDQNEIQINTISLGRMAEAVWPEFSPFIKNRREQSLIKLKNLYGEKKTDCALYIAEVAIISCLDEIISTVERSIKVSHSKEKELLNGSPNEPGQ